MLTWYDEENFIPETKGFIFNQGLRKEDGDMEKACQNFTAVGPAPKTPSSAASVVTSLSTYLPAQAQTLPSEDAIWQFQISTVLHSDLILALSPT